jgi:hypothetical protein
MQTDFRASPYLSRHQFRHSPDTAEQPEKNQSGASTELKAGLSSFPYWGIIVLSSSIPWVVEHFPEKSQPDRARAYSGRAMKVSLP